MKDGRFHGLRKAAGSSPGYVLTGLVLLLLSACQTVGMVRGGQGAVYQGTLTLDGGAVEAALELVPTGRTSVRGALQTGSGLMADGDGRKRGGNRLVVTLEYGGSCPGSLTLDGRWDEGEGRYEGTATAEDCTGRAVGRFSFARR